MFTQKFFISLILTISFLSNLSFSKKSFSKRSHRSLNSAATELDERGLEVVDVDLRALGFSGEELMLFDSEFVKRSSLKTTTVTAPSGINAKESGIGSWYHTDSTTDSTNGKSWCGFSYNDQTPGFAISLNLMGGSEATYGVDTALWREATNKYCGLQAEVSYKGKTSTLYIADGFDPAWVRTPYSIDIIYDAFMNLWGSTTNNKNDVMKNVTWKLTGKKAVAYTTKN